jgi:hypothetical protein
VDEQPASFVIRIWLESAARSELPEWRWHVLHVQSHHERYGRRLEDLFAFIGQESGVQPPTPSGE